MSTSLGDVLIAKSKESAREVQKSLDSLKLRLKCPITFLSKLRINCVLCRKIIYLTVCTEVKAKVSWTAVNVPVRIHTELECKGRMNNIGWSAHIHRTSVLRSTNLSCCYINYRTSTVLRIMEAKLTIFLGLHVSSMRKAQSYKHWMLHIISLVFGHFSGWSGFIFSTAPHGPALLFPNLNP